MVYFQGLRLKGPIPRLWSGTRKQSKSRCINRLKKYPSLRLRTEGLGLSTERFRRNIGVLTEKEQSLTHWLKRELAPRAKFELATLRLTAGGCKTLNALFGVAYDPEHLKSRVSVGQLWATYLQEKKGSARHNSNSGLRQES
jgi:hypothetical protein